MPQIIYRVPLTNSEDHLIAERIKIQHQLYLLEQQLASAKELQLEEIRKRTLDTIRRYTKNLRLIRYLIRKRRISKALSISKELQRIHEQRRNRN